MTKTFSIDPSPALARKANRAVHQALEQRLQATLNRVEQATSRSLPDARSVAERLRCRSPASPNWFSIQHGIDSALKHRDRDELVRLLAMLLEAEPETAGEDSLCVRSLGMEEADRAVSAFVAGPEGLGTRNQKGPEMQPVPSGRLDTCLEEVRAAADYLSALDSVLFEEAATHVRWVTLFRGEGVVGVSNRRAFGSVYIRASKLEADEPPLAYYIEHIVHESAHTHLNALMHMDPLVENDSDERFMSPLRDDPRPMRSIYHASFVLARLVRVFQRWQGAEDAPESVEDSLASFGGKLNDGLDVICDCARLTHAGSLMLDSMVEISP